MLAAEGDIEIGLVSEEEARVRPNDSESLHQIFTDRSHNTGGYNTQNRGPEQQVCQTLEVINSEQEQERTTVSPAPLLIDSTR